DIATGDDSADDGPASVHEAHLRLCADPVRHRRRRGVALVRRVVARRRLWSRRPRSLLRAAGRRHPDLHLPRTRIERRLCVPVRRPLLAILLPLAQRGHDHRPAASDRLLPRRGSLLGIFAGMAVMKVADGFLDISLGRLQRLSKFNTLGVLSSAHAVVSIIVISIAAWLSAPVGVLVGATGVVSLVITVPALVLSRTPSPVPASRTAQWRRVLNAALPLTASTGLMSLLASIPIWFLEAYSEPSEVGRFAAAAYLIVAANLMGAS